MPRAGRWACRTERTATAAALKFSGPDKIDSPRQRCLASSPSKSIMRSWEAWLQLQAHIVGFDHENIYKLEIVLTFVVACFIRSEGYLPSSAEHSQ